MFCQRFSAVENLYGDTLKQYKTTGTIHLIHQCSEALVMSVKLLIQSTVIIYILGQYIPKLQQKL